MPSRCESGSASAGFSSPCCCSAPARSGLEAPARARGALRVPIRSASSSRGRRGAVAGEVSAPPYHVSFGNGFAYPADGSVATAASIASSAQSDAGARATANASGDAATVSLFGGEITVDALSAKARASTSGRTATGDLTRASITNLTVLGQPATPSANGRIALADWGYLITLEQGTDTSAGPDGAQAFHGFVAGIDVHLTAPHGNLPAGSEIEVGYAEVSVQAPAPPKPKSVPPGTKKRAKTPAGAGAEEPRARQQPDSPRALDAAAEADRRRLRLPGLRAGLVFGHVRRLPRRRPRELAPRRRHLRAARSADPGLLGRDRLLRRLERRRRQPSLAARLAGQRVLLRAPVRFLAAREERAVGEGGRGARLRRQHGRRRRNADPPPLRGPSRLAASTSATTARSTRPPTSLPGSTSRTSASRMSPAGCLRRRSPIPRRSRPRSCFRSRTSPRRAGSTPARWSARSPRAFPARRTRA